VPLGEEAIAWLKRWLRDARPRSRGIEVDHVSSRRVRAAHRQGLVLVKRHAAKAGIASAALSRTCCGTPSRRTC